GGCADGTVGLAESAVAVCPGDVELAAGASGARVATAAVVVGTVSQTDAVTGRLFCAGAGVGAPTAGLLSPGRPRSSARASAIEGFFGWGFATPCSWGGGNIC